MVIRCTYMYRLVWVVCQKHVTRTVNSIALSDVTTGAKDAHASTCFGMKGAVEVDLVY